MSVRTAYIDRGIGETRGLICLDDAPERLFIRRDDDPQTQRLGARSIARVSAVDRTLGMAWLSMGEGPDAVLAGKAGEDITEGQSLEVQITSEARQGKSATARLIAESVGPPRLLADAPPIEAALRQWAPGEAERGPEARERIDEAQSLILQTVHPLAGGGSIAIEPTRALTAIDVDMGAAGGGDGARAQRRTNLQAIETAARLLRLKALGGLVVFDLAGQGHNGPVFAEAARQAFLPDNPGVSIGPISRFGLFELALPHRTRPLSEILAGADGRATAVTCALELVRAIERAAAADPGGRLTVDCAPDVGEAVKAYVPALAERIGARFVIDVKAGGPRQDFDVRTP